MENARNKQLHEFTNHGNLAQCAHLAIYKELINIDSTVL